MAERIRSTQQAERDAEARRQAAATEAAAATGAAAAAATAEAVPAPTKPLYEISVNVDGNVLPLRLYEGDVLAAAVEAGPCG